jgi:hypothetical protein
VTGMDPHDDRTGPDRPDDQLPPIWRNVLIGGEPGSGKAALLNLLAAHQALSPSADEAAPDEPDGAGE